MSCPQRSEFYPGSYSLVFISVFICNLAHISKLFSGESTEEELLRRLQQIKEGPPPQNSDENRGIFCFGGWVEDEIDKEVQERSARDYPETVLRNC